MTTGLQPDPMGPARLILDYTRFGARHSEAGALTNVLAHAGVIAPHTGEPITEDLLFGIGGGIGLGYFVYETSEGTSLFIATRITTQESSHPGLLQTICERVGVDFQVQHSSTASAAEKQLKVTLGAGIPVIAWADPGALPYYGTPFSYHTLVVYGIDEERDQVFVGDRSRVPLCLGRAELNAARERGHVRRFRALRVTKRGDPVDLSASVKQGLTDCIDQMRDGFGPANFRSNFGLKSLEKWANLLVDGRDKRGWSKMFPRGLELFEVLAGVFDQIENRGDGGSALRSLFADFLVQTNRLLGDARFLEAADHFQVSARLWGELAHALLPDSIPVFKETKQLATRKRKIFEESGSAANEEIDRIDHRLFEIRRLIEQGFPLPEHQTKDLLSELRTRVLAIHRCESAAIDFLTQIMG